MSDQRRSKRKAYDLTKCFEYVNTGDDPVIVNVSRSTQTSESEKTYDMALEEIRKLKKDMAKLDDELDYVEKRNEKLVNKLQEAKDDLDLLLTPSSLWNTKCPDAYNRRIRGTVWDEFQNR